ncbi:SET and MYND domain-containing protein 4-like [Chelonus insularis]|uniref:SET and MYND domain-containing protein 4-like n=1 Tax=Chelonus insularis TaxID=460826 RepID=UPI00158EE9C7|nr:SET and MYND domain-containing protein 4-like [Chelonus insularis]
MEDVLNILNKKLISTNNHKKCVEEYSLLKTDQERIIFTLNLLQTYNISKNFKCNEEKSVCKSREFNDKGNKLLLTPTSELNLDCIIDFYTKSVAYAPLASQELAFAYANRSTALFKAGLYEDCIVDINRALDLDYPNKWKAKLLSRKVRCLVILTSDSMPKTSNEFIKIKEPSIELLEIQKTIEQTRKWLIEMDPNDTSRKIVEKTINDPLTIATSVRKPFKKLPDERNCPDIIKNNPEIPGASSAVEIKYSEDFGKHVIATRDIKPGEILAIQESYASVLVLEKFYTHCWNCLKQTWTGIGCKNCVNVVFCSELCRKVAWREYHDLECGLIGLLIDLGINNLGILALRLAIKAFKEARNLQVLKKLVTEIDSKSDRRTQGFTNNILDDTKYASIYTLAKNTSKRSVPDLFGRSLNASFILYILAKNTKIFGDKFSDDWGVLKNDEEATFLGGLIMRHLQIIPSNVHSVTEENLQTKEPVERAAAMMPFYSLFNHSCNPMVERLSFGNKIILVAVSRIAKNQQIFDNYGFHYAITPKELRTQKLKQQYYFDCCCEACENNWPLYGHFGSYIDQKLRKEVKKKISNALKKFDGIYAYASKGEVESDDSLKAMKNLIQMLEILYECVSLPCIEVNKVLETWKRIYSLRGNRLLSIN